MSKEQLWQQFFSDPSQWWDNRLFKKTPKCPDFKHKSTHEGLWVESWHNPSWVKGKLAILAVDRRQSGDGWRAGGTNFLCNVGDMRKLCEEGRVQEAVCMLELALQRNIVAPVSTYACLLKECTRKKSLKDGKRLHTLILQIGFDSNIFLGNALIDMYAKCGCMSDARQVFDTMLKHNVFSWTAIISAYANQGHGQEAINLFHEMQRTGVALDKVASVVILKACAKIAALELGKQVHFDIIRSGFGSDQSVGNTLIDMYAKSGSIEDACEVFNRMKERDVVSWNAMIAGFARRGLVKDAIGLYERMRAEGKQPDNITYVVLLKACARAAALEQGKLLHSHIIKSGIESHVIVGSALIDMYAKCGHIEQARLMFDKISEPNVVSWNALITGYAQLGLGQDALDLYEKMKQEGLQPDNVTYVVLLKACTSIAAIKQGKQLHSRIIRDGFGSDVIVGNTLIDMYAKCGCIEDACEVFKKMDTRNAVSWNVMISGYAQQGFGKDALALYEQMKLESVHPDSVTCAVLLKACASVAALEQGRQLHCHIIETGIELNVIVGSALVDMYAKCGCIDDARQVFDALHHRNVVSWNAMIAGYARQGLGKEALALYEDMKQEGLQADSATYVALLKACAKITALEQGKQIHSGIIKSGCEHDPNVGNTLVDMYAKCGCIEDARKVFDNMKEHNVVSWNAMIGGYAQKGLGKEALALYEQMKETNLQPDNVTFVVALKACTSITALEQGKQLHARIIQSGFELDVIVGSSLVDMYAKCGCVEHARQVFNKMTEQDVTLWNAMISGYAQQGLGREGLALYEQMKQGGVRPDIITYVVVLKACASIAALEQGKQLHSLVIRNGFDSNMIVCSALVDMYAKSGCINDACEVFNSMRERDVVAWNAIIAGSAQQGLGKESLALLKQMQREGIKPNEVTYLSVLSACSHSGLVEEGCQVFNSMCEDNNVRPAVDHYACIVDLLGRAGHLANAEDFIYRMPIQPNAVIWMTLLGAARNHHHVEIGRRAFECVVKFEPENAGAYVLLSNLYAAAGMRDEVAKLRKKMKDVGVRKSPGCS